MTQEEEEEIEKFIGGIGSGAYERVWDGIADRLVGIDACPVYLKMRMVDRAAKSALETARAEVSEEMAELKKEIALLKSAANSDAQDIT